MNILEITSRDNEKIKFLKKLKKSKYRDQFGKFFVENATIIADAAKAGFGFESLFVTKNFIEKNPEKFDFILKNAEASEYYVIDEKVNESFSDMENSIIRDGQGMKIMYFSSILHSTQDYVYYHWYEIQDLWRA